MCFFEKKINRTYTYNHGAFPASDWPATGNRMSRVTRSKPQDTWPGALPKSSSGRIRIPFLTDSFSAVGGRFFWTTHVFCCFFWQTQCISKVYIHINIYIYILFLFVHICIYTLWCQTYHTDLHIYDLSVLRSVINTKYHWHIGIPNQHTPIFANHKFPYPIQFQIAISGEIHQDEHAWMIISVRFKWLHEDDFTWMIIPLVLPGWTLNIFNMFWGSRMIYTWMNDLDWFGVS